MEAVAFTRTAIQNLKKVPVKDREAIVAKLDNYAHGRAEDVIVLKGSDLLRTCHGD